MSGVCRNCRAAAGAAGAPAGGWRGVGVVAAVTVTAALQAGATRMSKNACGQALSGYNYSNCIYKQVRPKMSDLTPRQTQIRRLIQRVNADTGMPPTRAEIANE